MALEPAGISLAAENFNKYIKQLNAIDKTQQAIFDVDDKELANAFGKATKAAKKYDEELQDITKTSKKAATASKGVGLATAGAAGAGLAAVTALSSAIVTLGTTSIKVFAGIVKEGVLLNQQFELSEKVFTNVFGDPNLGKATVDFLNETADGLRIGRKEAAQFAQTILPKSGGLDKFTDLLRLTDIQADTTGQSIGELEFSIREALSGDFVSLKDRFDLGTEQINRIKELTPELGRSQALIQVITQEFTRLGKTDISGTLGTNIKDLQSQFTNFQAVVGKPTFDVLKVQSDNLLKSLERNEEGIKRTSIALGEVTGNIVELVGTEIVSFIDSLDFKAIETGIDNLNAFVESLRLVGVVIKEAFQTGVIQTAFGLLTGSTNQVLAGINKIKDADFAQSFENIAAATTNATDRQSEYKKKVDETANAQSSFTDESRASIDAFLGQSEAEDQARQGLESYNSTLKKAEQLQLSFSRAAEDTAIKLARANEDIARKQAQSVAKLAEKQKGDRDKLLKDQTKRLDKFEADRRKQISKAEGDIQKARKEAADQQKRGQQKLQRELAQAQERFNLSQLQSERRFGLSEQRLRAEGDILALQQLREDREIERQEEKENFGLSKKEQIASGKEQQKEQAKDLESRVNELKSSLEDQRAELLKSFDDQLVAQQEAQVLAKAEQQRGFEDAALERQIQLQREEEDRRLSQSRQLEDLGRSLAEQKGVTTEGSTAIAGELEKVFGVDGVADNIMAGFTDRTESDFKDLFEDVGEIVSEAEIPEPSPIPLSTGGGGGGGGFGGRIGGVQEFAEGGIVGGPIGSPQPIIAHGGETVLPTHQQSFTMTAPVIPSQNLNVNMDGGFNITGGGEAGEAATQAAVAEMTENFRIAVQRLVRRN